MKKFEIGQRYCWAEPDFGDIEVIDRTRKSIVVFNGTNTWRMFIKYDENGDEYVVDSSVPLRMRDTFTCSAKWDDF